MDTSGPVYEEFFSGYVEFSSFDNRVSLGRRPMGPSAFPIENISAKRQERGTAARLQTHLPHTMLSRGPACRGDAPGGAHENALRGPSKNGVAEPIDFIFSGESRVYFPPSAVSLPARARQAPSSLAGAISGGSVGISPCGQPSHRAALRPRP